MILYLQVNAMFIVKLSSTTNKINTIACIISHLITIVLKEKVNKKTEKAFYY